MKHLFGSGSTKKTVPTWILALPPEKLRILWTAYTAGDGYARDNTQEWRSVSYDLAAKIALIAARLGYRPSLRLSIPVPKDEASHPNPIWTGGVTLEVGKGNPALYVKSDDYVFNQVHDVTTYSDKHQRVYDLTVENDESFVVGHAAVHNCRRIGQQFPTTIWFLHAVGTVDERVDQIVKQKRQIVRSAIGAHDIEETPLLAVEEMIKNWQAKIDETGIEFAGLGLGTILPALPSPKETHAITFSGSEWHLQKALLWCKMNGYIPSSKTDLQGRFKLVVHPPHVFNKNKFKIFSVSKDIKIIHGERLSKANERRIRNQLRGMR
jgi:hypothetical protein